MYEILQHPADEKFRSEGESIEDAFSEAVKALSEITGSNTEGMYSHNIKCESENIEALLYDFLDKLIVLQDTEGVVVSKAESIQIEEERHSWILESDIIVDDITSEMSLLDIKAPTYNEMKVDYEDGKWVLEAVLDV